MFKNNIETQQNVKNNIKTQQNVKSPSANIY